MTRVSAVVVSHGGAAELRESLPALVPQVDELVVIANVPGSADDTPPGTRVLVNERPLGFAANANRGIAETTGDFVLLANPDAVAEPDAVATLRAFAESHPRCGVAGPRMLGLDGELDHPFVISVAVPEQVSWVAAASVRSPGTAYLLRRLHQGVRRKVR